MSEELDGVSLIIPTFGREEVLKTTLPSYLTQPGVDEVILVNDGCEGFEEAMGAAFPDPPVPLRIVSHPRNLGSCAARNSGILAARGRYVMIGEDDVILAEGHVATLLSEARAVGADVIAGVVYRLLGDETLEEAKARARRNPTPAFDLEKLNVRLDAQLEETTEVLFAHALVLLRRELALEILFDPKYGGPSFKREDNEFCLAARARGARVFLCPHAEATHLPRDVTFGGGARADVPTTTMILSTVTNQFLFVDRYFEVLREAGFAGSAAGLKARIAAQAVAFTTHRNLEAKSGLYRGALRAYRRGREAVKRRVGGGRRGGG